jgi:anti-anti-sigma regulatory factor
MARILIGAGASTMSELAITDDGRQVLLLPQVCDLSIALRLKEQLAEGLAAGTGLVLDGEAVQRITSPCLQLIAAAAKSFREAGGPCLTISNPSVAFCDAVTALALGPALGMHRG